MEIKGRECEEVKIGGDKLYFLTSYKGKEYRKILEIQFGENAKVDASGNVEFNAGKLFASVPELFPVLCIDIVKGEDHITPSSEYLDELEVEDYQKVQEILTTKMGEVVGSKKAQVK